MRARELELMARQMREIEAYIALLEFHRSLQKSPPSGSSLTPGQLDSQTLGTVDRLLEYWKKVR